MSRRVRLAMGPVALLCAAATAAPTAVFSPPVQFSVPTENALTIEQRAGAGPADGPWARVTYEPGAYANFAPADMRGRYLAVFGISWTIAGAVGPWGAGIIMDNGNPDWIWYLAGITSAVAAVGFFILHLITKERFAATDLGDQTQGA